MINVQSRLDAIEDKYRFLYKWKTEREIADSLASEKSKERLKKYYEVLRLDSLVKAKHNKMYIEDRKKFILMMDEIIKIVKEKKK